MSSSFISKMKKKMPSLSIKKNSLPDLIINAINSVVGDGPVNLHEPTFSGNEWTYVK